MNSFTSGQVANFCGVTLRTVIRWIDKGHLKGFKLPGRGNNRILAEDLLHFFQQHNMPIPEALSYLLPKKEVVNKVLIVDDDQQMANAIQGVIRNMSLETAIAHDGFEAGSKLTLFSPAIITLDLQMSGMNGFNVIKSIRANEQYQHLQIIIISALSVRELDRAISLGANQYLSKPFTNEDLSQAINTALQKIN